LGNEVFAYYWLLKAARQGNADAQYELGMLLFDGLDKIPSDKVASFILFSLSAKQSTGPAEIMRDITAEKMTKEKLAEAKKQLLSPLSLPPLSTIVFEAKCSEKYW